MKRSNILFLVLVLVLICIPTVMAHVPYIERKDIPETDPFRVRRSIEQSIAVYSWIGFEAGQPATDIDVYTFTLSSPQRVFLEVIVPECDGYYANFTPWFALVGPGLPDPGQALPFDIPDGCGAIVLEDVAPGQPRERFYEPFGGKWYLQGPRFDQTVNVTGAYAVYYWDPYQTGGDYVAVLGYRELFPPVDILRSLINTPLIRRGWELHLPCSDPAGIR